MNVPPPKTESILMAIVEQWNRTHHGQDNGLPIHSNEAAKTWMSLQEPENKDEHARIVRGKDGEERWHYPYLDRVVYCMSRYLKHGVEERHYILSAMQSGIAWRGDEIDRFKHIVEEHETMREIGLDDYRKLCRENTRRMLGGMKL